MGILGALAGVPAAQPQGGKVNWLGVLADALAGAAGRQGPYATMLAQRHMLDLENAQYEARQQAEYNRQVQLYDYQRLHPNDETTQLMVAAGIDPHSTQGQSMYSTALQNHINPFTAIDVQQPDGSVQRQFVRQPTIPPAPVGNLRPLPTNGGQTAPAPSATFPRNNRKK